MKIEVYVPDHEIEVVQKILSLKEKRKLSSYIVELLKKEDTGLTEEKIIELIKKYAPESKNTDDKDGLEDSINSILSGF